jgi:hypothetical protein
MPTYKYWVMTKYESQQWAEMGLSLKEYHKGWVWDLNNTTKANKPTMG